MEIKFDDGKLSFGIISLEELGELSMVDTGIRFAGWPIYRNQEDTIRLIYDAKMQWFTKYAVNSHEKPA